MGLDENGIQGKAGDKKKGDNFESQLARKSKFRCNGASNTLTPLQRSRQF